jgi:hypothetical protein
MTTVHVLVVDGSNWVREEDYRRLELNAGNLLALIHRDGGHYINDNGWDKAFSDAINVVNQLRIDLDAIQYTYKSALMEMAECKERRLESVSMVDLLRQELAEARAALSEADDRWQIMDTDLFLEWRREYAAALKAAREDKP